MELSEEEKEAIEQLNKRYKFLKRNNQVVTDIWLTLDVHNLGILLNITDKLQKEIDREKQYSDFYEDLCNKQQKEIENLANGIRVLGTNPSITTEELIEEFRKNPISKEYLEKFRKEYISKDKIREKIKELKQIIEFEKPTYEDCLKYTIDILEELLEESK